MNKKIRFKLAYFLFTLFLPCVAFGAEDTNNLFLPENLPQTIYQNQADSIVLNQKAQDAAIKAGECIPAEKDPNGNWGPCADGFQLSVRACTNVFTAGGPIQVAVILRNTTTNDMTVAIMDGMEDRLEVRDSAGQLLQENKLMPGGSGRFHVLLSRRQIKEEIDLAQRMELKPGTYTIRAEQSVFDRSKGLKNLNEFTNLASGSMTIVIVPAK